VLDRQALTDRKKKVGDNQEESSSDSDSDISDGALEKKAIKKMQAALEDGSDEADDEEAEDEDMSEDDGVIKMDFQEGKNIKKAKKTDKGINAMKFMTKSEDKHKEQLKADT